MTILLSVLETMVLKPIFPAAWGISIGTEFCVYFVILLAIIQLAIDLLTDSRIFKGFRIIPLKIQLVLEKIHKIVLDILGDNIHSRKGQTYFPVIFFIFLFVALNNEIGLIPYSFSLTSHISMTFSFAIANFIAINIIGFKKHGVTYFSLLLPSGTPILLALLLVPIELISYIFRPISLSIRLFANIMAGHTLVQVVLSFAMILAMSFSIWQFGVLIIVVILILLETAVSLIQAFVFAILITIYLNDALNLH
jgi:ATP synthase subunit 6